MKRQNCDCGFDCTVYSIAASIIIGIVTAILRFTAVITLTPAFLWVLFGIAVVYLAVDVIATAVRTRDRECQCQSLSARIAGVLGTILTSVILLGITFAATSLIGAVISGLLLFFFSLLITSTACLIRCKAGCDDDE